MGGPDILKNQRADASSTGKVINIIANLFLFFRTGVYLFARGRGARALFFIFPHRGLCIRTGARGAGGYFYFSAQGFIYSYFYFSAQGFIYSHRTGVYLFTRGIFFTRGARGAGVYFIYAGRGGLFLFLFFRAGFDVFTRGRGVLF
jgi:hypothetical protein